MKKMKTSNAIMLFIFLVLLWFCFLLGGCKKVTTPEAPAQLPVTSQPLTPTPGLENTPAPSPPIPVDNKASRLSWGKKDWDYLLLESVRLNIKTLSKASDLPSFYDRSVPRYSDLTEDQKVHLIAELLVQVMKHESNWKPDCYYVETTMGIDPITGRQVASEGLFQLSYQDQKNYLKYFDCGFDWEKDKLLSNKDPRKTIFDVKKNITCGVNILAKQVERYGAISIAKGAYWSTLKIGSRHNKIKEIKEKLKTITF